MVERELALLLMERRLQAGATFAEMVRAGDPDLAQLLLVRIAELRAEQRGIDLDLARLALAVAPQRPRPRNWLTANTKHAKRDGAVVLVTRQEAVPIIGQMRRRPARGWGVLMLSLDLMRLCATMRVILLSP